jgi:hypothetical protein
MRKFKYNNQNYEYVVGDKFIKIVNRDTNKYVLLDKESNSYVYFDCELNCNHDRQNPATACGHAWKKSRVTPSTIKNLIQREGI